MHVLKMFTMYMCFYFVLWADGKNHLIKFTYIQNEKARIFLHFLNPTALRTAKTLWSFYGVLAVLSAIGFRTGLRWTLTEVNVSIRYHQGMKCTGCRVSNTSYRKFSFDNASYRLNEEAANIM